MFKSSRKKLIAVGCSFTEHYLVSSQSPHIDHDFIRWPQYLAEMLDMGFVNLGRSGAGNDQILAKTLDAVIKEKDVGLVVLMWSEWQRIGFQRFKNWDIWHQVTPHMSDDYALKLFELQSPLHATRNALRTFIHAEKLLRDIPYMLIQGSNVMSYYNTRTLKGIDCSPGTPHENDNFYKLNDSRTLTAREMFACHDYFNYIENNIGDKFIGWPIMREIGGYCVSDILEREDPLRTTLRISQDDSHPNAAGHKFMADFLYDKYKEIYNNYNV